MKTYDHDEPAHKEAERSRAGAARVAWWNQHHSETFDLIRVSRIDSWMWFLISKGFIMIGLGLSGLMVNHFIWLQKFAYLTSLSLTITGVLFLVIAAFLLNNFGEDIDELKHYMSDRDRLFERLGGKLPPEDDPLWDSTSMMRNHLRPIVIKEALELHGSKDSKAALLELRQALQPFDLAECEKAYTQDASFKWAFECGLKIVG